jgi:hypothetical protein
MKLQSIIAIVFLSVLLVSCASSTVSRSVIGSVAFIRGVSHEKTRTDFDAFYLESIDGAPVSTPSFRSSFAKPVPISPGERVIVVHYEGMDGKLTKLPRIAQASVKAKIEAGVTYVVDGRDEGDTVLMWISRADTGEKVTKEALATKIDLQPALTSPLLKYLILIIPIVR